MKEEVRKYTYEFTQISKNLIDEEMGYITTMRFTVDGIILAVRKPTRADLPKDEVEQFKLAAREFQEIYKFEYGVDLTDSEASKKALTMLQFFDALTSDESEIIT